MRRLLIPAALLLAGAFSAPVALADYAVLRSGQRLHITGYELTGDIMRLSLGGGTVEIPASDILRIEPEDVFLDTSNPPATPSGPYGKEIHQSATKSGVDEDLVSSVISAESGFNPSAISPKNAQGLMQLIPSTSRAYGVKQPFNPAENIEGGTRYLKDLLDQYHGDMALALAAYNAGPKRVDQYNGVPPYSETRAYVKRVSKKYAARKKAIKPSRTPVCYPELVVCSEPQSTSGK
jgi:soluble lytic murein transglycosylase-like protein